jgi:RecJ-like exonuclease
MKSKLLTVALITTLLLSALNVAPALAQGPFEKECPTCHGTRRVVCTNCQGSGKITTTQTCQTCQGSGVVEPDITRKSMNGYGTLVGLDWVARVEGVFHNEEDVGTYGVARSEVHTVTTTYYHTSARTYLPPHQDVTITIDTPEITFGEDWTYTIYLSQADDITCPDCHGTGAISVLSNCPECGGSGWVTCPTCDGSGHVTNQVAVGVAIAGVVAVAAVAIVAVAVVKRRKTKVATEKA